MQLLIDTDTETNEGLLIVIRALTAYANAKTQVPTPSLEKVPTGTEVDPAQAFGRPLVVTPPAPAAALSVPPAPTMMPTNALPVTTTAEATIPSPLALFRQSTTAPIATAAVTTSVPPISDLAIVPPPVPAASNAAASAVAISSQIPTTTPTVSAPANAVDSAGLPWDARIHSETRNKNADGTWRCRRGLDPIVKATVMAELKGGDVPAPAVQENIRYDGPTATVVPPPPVPAPLPVPAPPALGVPGPNPSAGVSTPVTSFRDLMGKVNVALSQGKLTQPQLQEACKAAGVDSVSALASQPMLVPAVDQHLSRWLAA